MSESIPSTLQIKNKCYSDAVDLFLKANPTIPTNHEQAIAKVKMFMDYDLKIIVELYLNKILDVLPKEERDKILKPDDKPVGCFSFLKH